MYISNTNSKANIRRNNRVAQWHQQIAEADEIIAEYDCMGHDELIKALSSGNLTLAYAVKSKQRAEEFLAKHCATEVAEKEVEYA